MSLKALIVMPTNGATWIRTMELPFPPFPGLGIRVDTYEILNVDSVVIGDYRHDVTCIVQREGDHPFTTKECEALGFEIASYP